MTSVPADERGRRESAAQHRPSEARTFVVVVTPACLVAWQAGWNLGAFETIDYRWSWNVWVLSVVALVASALFRRSEFRLGAGRSLVLLLPSVEIAVDYVVDSETNVVALLLALVTLVTLPVALYVLAQLLAGDFFTLGWRNRVAAGALVGAVLVVGGLTGAAHDRYVWCEDFERIGDLVPADCTPEQ